MSKCEHALRNTEHCEEKEKKTISYDSQFLNGKLNHQSLNSKLESVMAKNAIKREARPSATNRVVKRQEDTVSMQLSFVYVKMSIHSCKTLVKVDKVIFRLLKTTQLLLSLSSYCDAQCDRQGTIQTGSGYKQGYA